MTDTMASPSARARGRAARLVVAPSMQPRVVWERIDVDRYEVLADRGAVGFIDVVGHVFVALAGARYDQATEIAQSVVFETAVAALVSVDSRGGAG